MSRRDEFLASMREKWEALRQRVEGLASRIEAGSLADLRAELEVVHTRLASAMRAGAELGEEAMRSLGAAMERLAAAVRRAEEGDRRASD